MTQKHVIIIGSGIIGVASAYYLAKAGWRVEIIDRGACGAACSSGNCGLIVPSHVLPLPAPRAMTNALKAMFGKNPSFYIKPRLDFTLFSWLLGFASRCRTKPMLEAAAARHALLSSSRTLYDDLIAEELVDCEWETRGCLFVYMNPKHLDDYAETERLLRERFNVSATRCDGVELTKLEPALKEGLAGAWYYETNAHLRPDKLMSGWREVLERLSVQIHEHCEVRAFDRERSRVVSIQTDKGPKKADTFLVATGSWTPLLNNWLGCRIPIQPGKGYSITMPRPKTCPVIPLILEDYHVVVTPMRSGYRLGSMMEFAGYDTSIKRDRLEVLKEGASHYLREPYGETIEQEWYGWRPMTYDGKPIIDRCPAVENLYVAAGHNMIGMSTAPSTGKLVSEILSGTPPHVDPRPFRIDRF